MAHNRSTLNILSLNCQSIRNKTTEISNHLSKCNIDIALFNETWLTNQHKLYFHDYTTYRADRCNGQHGGVALSIRNTIKHSLIPNINTLIIEAVGIKIINSKNEEIYIISCYFPGSSNAHTLNQFKNDIATLTSLTKKSYFLIGDFNAKHRLWNNVRANQAGKILHSEMSRKQFVIHHSPTPTYHPPQTRATHPSTIDVCITNNIHTISQIESQIALSSDHNPIIFSIYCSSQHVPRKTTLRYDKADWSKFQKHISDNINVTNTITNTAAIDTEINVITDLLNTAIDISVPKTSQKTHTLHIPLPIKHMMSERNTLRRKWQRTHCPKVRIRINSLTRQIHRECMELKNKIFNTNIASLDKSSKKFWQVTKALKNQTNVIPPLRNVNTTNRYTTNTDKANAIASCFAKAHLTTHHWISHTAEQIVNESIINLNNSPQNNITDTYKFHTKPTEIRCIIKNMKNNKAPGLDNINNTVLKHLPKKGVVKLTHIYNACLNFGHFPTKWKEAKVIALPKPHKDNTLPSNYRPISLLSAMSKILERIILHRLSSHIEEHKILPNEQFGFRRGHSTVHQLARVVKHIKSAQSKKQSTGLVTLDMEKAFDSIWHKGLIHKMMSYNFAAPLCKIVASFLYQRTFAVHILESTSSSYNIVAGVPQGSCLSPTLFNIYTSDIPKSNVTQIALFADDTAVYHSHESAICVIRAIEKSLDILSKYYQTWKIKLNESKTQAIFFTRRRTMKMLPRRNLVLNNNEIEWQDDIKYLGMILDKKLTFKKHCAYSNERAQKYIRILYPLINRRSHLNIHNKSIIIKCIFRPMLLYSGEVWGICAEAHIKHLQITQNKLLKLIHNLPHHYNTAHLHSLCNINTIEETLYILKHKFTQNCHYSDNILISSLY